MNTEDNSQIKTGGGISANTLKIIAILAMLIDHVAWAFVPWTSFLGQAMHIIGRLTAPIMCYFIAEGYHHTRNVKRYAIRLGVFALISHAPFVYFETGGLPLYFDNGIRLAQQTGVIYTLFLGLLALIVWNSRKLKEYVKWVLIILIFIASIPGDWSLFAVLWILIFGIYHGRFREQMLGFSIVSLFVVIFTLQTNAGAVHWGSLFQLGVFLVIPLLHSYNEERGYAEKHRWIRWIFYVFYPLHLLILGLLRFV